MQWAAVGIALSAAVGFAINTTCQHHGASRIRAVAGAHWWVRLATRPVWLAGSIAGLVAVALQALALASGPITIVQPVLTTELIFALSATALLTRRRPVHTEWLWAGALLAGLTIFLFAAHPMPGPSHRIGHTTILIMTVGGLLLAGGLATVAVGPASRYRAALLGASTGVGFGVTSILGKYCLLQLRAGPLHVITDWPVWVLLVVALTSVAVEQAAFHAGPLAASLPPLTVIEPLVATIGGVVALDETLRVSFPALLIETLSGLILLLAALRLARDTAAEP